jgi:hypothetical protein
LTLVNDVKDWSALQLGHTEKEKRCSRNQGPFFLAATQRGLSAGQAKDGISIRRLWAQGSRSPFAVRRSPRGSADRFY